MTPATSGGDAVVARAVARVRRRLIPFLFLLYIVAYLDRINVGFAALQMNAALGFSSAAYGLASGIFFVGYTLFEIPSNMMLAKVGARLWIARIMISWGVVSAATMFVRDAWTFSLLRFMLGVAEAGFFPGIIFYLTNWVPERERARTIAAFMTATLTAGIVGGPLSGALLGLDGTGGLAGWQWLFLLEGIPSVVLGVVVLRLLTERPGEAAWLPEEERRALIERLRDEERQRERDRHRADSVGRALASTPLWLLAAVYFTIPVALYAFGFFLPQIIQSSFAAGDFETGLLSAIPYIGGAVAMLAVGSHSDQSGERRWHIAIAAACGGLGLIAAAFAPGIVLSMAMLTIGMMGLASMFGPFWTFTTSFVSGAGAAAGIAFVNSVGNIGGFVGPYLLGALRDRTASFAPGLVLIGLTLIAGGLLVFAVRDGSAGNAEPQEAERSR
jgi:ACS family tartrate transporter-like MFS transporter